jgi:hypothetical protein
MQDGKIRINGNIKAKVYYIDSKKIEEKIIWDIKHTSKKVEIKDIKILRKDPIQAHIFFELQYK